MAARYGHLINKWTVAAVAALAVMAALFAAALPVWAQQADRPPTIRDATTVFTYNEGDTIPVTTYTGDGPGWQADLLDAWAARMPRTSP